MAEDNRIGSGRCPVCHSDKARFTVTKKQLACVTCNGCNFQGFARSDRSDELLRKHIKAEAAPEPSPPTPAPPAPTPEPAPAPSPAPAPAAKAGGLMSSWLR